MKAITKFMGGLVLSILLINGSYAQTPHVTPDPYTPKPLTDQTLGTRMQKDFTSRNPNLQDTPVSWYQFSEGYYGTYANENTTFMSRYDKKGNYIQTFRKVEWKDDTNTALKHSFERSLYKDQDITAYWESTDPKIKNYYLETTDEKGKVSRVWVDDKGKFSTKPNIPKGM